MVAPLDPARLTPAASLNRAPIAELPGTALPARVRGRTAFELLSAQALAGELRQHAAALGLAGAARSDDDALLRAFDGRIAAADPQIRAAAGDLADRFGRYLAALILTLRWGDAAARAARPEWDDSYWTHWAGIATIWIGGGIVSGRLGPPLVGATARALAAAGMTDCAVRLASWPARLPLIGAARAGVATGRAGVVLDFGHSFVKRAVATYDNGALVGLRSLPPQPARWSTLPTGATPSAESAARLGQHMVEVLADTWHEVRESDLLVAPTVVASIASYLRDGQPLPRQGGTYASLAALSENLEGWLSAQLAARTGQPLGIRLLHDGTAAACAYAGESRTAVITLGTSLGVGFAPPAAGFRPLAPHLTVG